MKWLIINGLIKKRENKLIDLNGDQTLFQLLMILEIAGQGSPGRLRWQKIWSAEVIRMKPYERYYDAFDNNLLERVIINNPVRTIRPVQTRSVDKNQFMTRHKRIINQQIHH